MPLSKLPGQPRALAALSAALKGDTVHHAYLFQGPEGVGKEAFARAFAQALTCPERPGEGCGVCHSCGRIERQNHPDVSLLLTEEAQVARGLLGRADLKATPSRDIRVEQVRGLQERLMRRPLEAPRKVAMVVGAEALNPSAQNAFLKTLEEPPADTVLILVTASPNLLLPTLLSRMAHVSFGPLPEAEVARVLVRDHGWKEDRAQAAAALADGSLGRALALDEETLAEREGLVRSFEALGSPVADADPAVVPMLQFAELHGGSRDSAEAALRLLLSWNWELGRASGGVSRTGGLSTLATELAGRLGPRVLERRHRLLSQTLEAVTERNGAPRLQLEGLLLRMFVS